MTTNKIRLEVAYKRFGLNPDMINDNSNIDEIIRYLQIHKLSIKQVAISLDETKTISIKGFGY